MADSWISGDEDIRNWVRESGTLRSVQKIPGDASTRQYYRLHTQSEKPEARNSYILMRMEPFSGLGHSLPFIAVATHLRESGVDVPEIFDVDPARGILLLEDLGDITLLKKLQDASTPQFERELYQQVLDRLIHLQLNCGPTPSSASLQAFQLRFDFEKLLWEINHTIEHFYEVYLNRKISTEDRHIMAEGFSKICQVLDAEPTVLAHRDFHSRNIMALPPHRFIMIDFQDARMGPPQYDLASLLRDSYYQLEEKQIDFLLGYYLDKWERLSGKKVDRDRFRYVFDLMSVQRNFKAIGSFASFLNKRGNATYLKYIGNTFENIRRTLLRYPDYARLREVLFHYYYF